MWLGTIGLMLSSWLGQGPAPAPRVPAEFAWHPRVADAARALAQTATGRAVLARYVSTDYRIVVGASSRRISNTRDLLARISGHPPDFLTDHVARQVILFNDTLSPAAIAVGLTHEIIHVLGGAPPGTRSLGDEELRAWNVALDFFLGLPDSLRASAESKYAPYARWRSQEPQQFATTMRCQYPDTPGCPVVSASSLAGRPATGVESAARVGRTSLAEGGASAVVSECRLPGGTGRRPERSRGPTTWRDYATLIGRSALWPLPLDDRKGVRIPCAPMRSPGDG